MTKKPRKAPKGSTAIVPPDYRSVVAGMVDLLEQARRASARAVNALMTATYWEIGRRIVECEQGGRRHAGYGEELIQRLSADLTARFGRGFSRQNLQRFREFYLAFLCPAICSTLSGKKLVASDAEKCSTVSSKLTPVQKFAKSPVRHSGAAIFQTSSEKSPARRIPNIRSTLLNKSQTSSSAFSLADLARAFPLAWSHYVLLVGRSRSPEAMAFYHAEALRGGWSVRQLKRQIDSQFYERTALSRNKAAMLDKGAKPKPEDAVSAEEEVKDPLVLEFLGLKDEYSEIDLEEALIRHLESFLLELGGEFAFVGRQRRLRIDDEWFRIDLLFFHRLLRCLVVIDLKLGRFTHADAGQMHLYLNYAREHWTQPGENPPVGIVLCADKGEALVHYATEGLPNKVVVREYLTALPDEQTLADEINKTRRLLERRG